MVHLSCQIYDAVEDLFPKSVRMLAKTERPHRPSITLGMTGWAIHSLGHLCFPFRFEMLKISLMGFQLRPDSYAIERQNLGLNG